MGLKVDNSLVIGGLFRNPNILELLAKTSSTLRKQDKRVNLSYKDYRHRPFLELVKEGQIELAFTMQEDVSELESGLSATHLFDDPLVVIMQNNRPLAAKKELHIAYLSDQNLLAPSGSYSLVGYKIAEHLFEKYHATPVMNAVFLQTIYDYPTIDIGDGILMIEKSLLPLSAANRRLRKYPNRRERCLFPLLCRIPGR